MMHGQQNVKKFYKSKLRKTPKERKSQFTTFWDKLTCGLADL